MQNSKNMTSRLCTSPEKPTHLPTLSPDHQELIEELTATVHRVIGAPLDKITVFIQEIPQNRWGEGGVLGTNPEFAELSRRRAAPAQV